MKRSFSRVAVVNRGEAALRFIHAALELNREGERLRTIALTTEPERHALFAREADEVYDLGPAVTDPGDGRRTVAYLDLARLERALRETRAEAAWPGWGFVAEQPAFVELCESLGVTFIGPSAAAMRALGDKVSGKRLAESLGIPVVPWSGAAVASDDDAVRQASSLGYPVVVKPAFGNGGRGVREADSAADLASALKASRAEAWKVLGQRVILLERRLDGVRQVDVQVIADAWGGVWAFSPREASIQRRHQKLVEEAPAPSLPASCESALRQAAVRMVRAAGYVGAAAIEFLCDPASGDFWFLEANTRLEVEHAVTEVTTGLDLVKLQVHVARGGRLPGDPPPVSGHAVEARLCAEDPTAGFVPAPGTVARLRLPGGPGLRVDAGVGEGDLVPAEYDSMIAKVVAHGRDREEALGRLARALTQTTVILRGGTTNKAFLLDLLDREEVRSARLDVRYLDRLVARGEQTSRRYAEVALVRAAIEAYDAEAFAEKGRFLSSARRGRPEVRPELARSVEMRQGGQSYRLSVRRVAGDRYRVEEGGQRAEVTVERLGAPLREPRLQTSEWRLSSGGSSYRVLSLVQDRSHALEVDGVPHAFTREAPGLVTAPAPAVVVSIAVEPGDEVQAGQPLVIVEAMKMETSVVAPSSGRVREVLVVPNVQVGPGDPLIVIEPERSPDARPREKRLQLDALGAGSAAPPAGSRQALDDLRGLTLGYDVEPAGLREALARGLDGAGETVRAATTLLGVFADVCSLFRRRGEGGEDLDDGEAFGSEEYLFTYMRKLEERGAGLPDSFVAKLRRALRHYGVVELEPTPDLVESLYRVCKAHQREETIASLLSTVVERFLDLDPALLVGVPELSSVLDRLVSATQSRYTGISDLAREVRFRVFERPLLERVRREAFARAEDELAVLAGEVAASERQARVRDLVQCPQPLAALLVQRWVGAPLPLRQAILEVLLRRFYRIRELEQLQLREVDGHPFATATYARNGGTRQALVTHAGEAGLPATLSRLGRLAEQVDAGDALVADVFVWKPEGPGPADTNAEEIRQAIAAAGLPRPFHRIVVAVAGPGQPVQHFTFRAQAEGGYAEETFFRDAHPMMAKRLQLHRLQHFTLERLPSVEDVYLFRAVAKGNPRDERLFVLAEVRDLTRVPDPETRISQLPELERMLVEALGAIRAVQARRPAGQRLHNNRVILHVWPVLDVPRSDLDAFVRRYAAATEGLGLDGITILGRVPGSDGQPRDSAVFLSKQPGRPVEVRFEAPQDTPIAPLSQYEQKVARLAQRGLVYPYELVRMLTPSRDAAPGAFPPGEFVEHDLDERGERLVPVERPWGENKANIIAGVIRNFTPHHPEGVTRVLLLGDPSRELGSLAEPECRRVVAALALARELRCPLDWLALSAGAKIATDSGTENMDWIALVLRRLIEFTQAGGEVNIVVNGINVGGQPYWNAEATMLMHTKGILVMMPDSAMVLTGKRALDFSGGVSAEDNQGIGGYERVMGPNGQAQYFARDIADACQILLRHHDHAYVVPGDVLVRRVVTCDPVERDVCAYPYARSEEHGFSTVGDVLTDSGNPDRKKPFEIRNVMAAVVDQDHAPLERWAGWRDAETVVVWDAHLGGWPVSVLGIESKPVPRLGTPPADGPEQWTGGTLFPQSSRKAARAINAASGNRPLVVLANLTGFDGSPESLRNWQLEYGAEIGRAVTNFEGPIVFCVVSRYHGGAFVVFSQALHDNFRVIALEGTYASVIGGAPAAAVVFSREVEKRTAADPRVKELEAQVAAASGPEKARLRAALRQLTRSVQSEKLGEVADEYDAVHSVERAQRVGSVHEIIPAARLRPHLVEAIEDGIAKHRERLAARRA